MVPGEVETLVTFPIESRINGAAGVRRVRSATAVGISVVWVEFDWGTDIYRPARSSARSCQLIAASLPPEIGAADPRPGLVGHGRDPVPRRSRRDAALQLELRTIADRIIRRRLLSVPGVAQVVPIGGGVKQYQVVLAPAQVRAYGADGRRRARALRDANQNVSAGFDVRSGAGALIHGVGRVSTTEDIARHGGRRARRRAGAGRPTGRRRHRRSDQARRGLGQRRARRDPRRAEAARRQHAGPDRATRPRCSTRSRRRCRRAW